MLICAGVLIVGAALLAYIHRPARFRTPGPLAHFGHPGHREHALEKKGSAPDGVELQPPLRVRDRKGPAFSALGDLEVVLAGVDLDPTAGAR